MSQEKVDRYKQEKASRKQIMRKQKVVAEVNYDAVTNYLNNMSTTTE